MSRPRLRPSRPPDRRRPSDCSTTIWVAESLRIVAETLPNFTAVELARLVPVMVTVVPPAAGPRVGLMAVTAGAGT